jgi:phosphoserine phosphatase
MSRWLAALALAAALAAPAADAGGDPLPSWREGRARQAILAFVQAVTDPASAQYVAPGARIAAFDNDGTLWSEQPLYVQLAFAIDRVRALAPRRPEWKTTQPFQAVLEDDRRALAAAGQQGLLKLVLATHAGMTADQFARTVAEWLETARHPRFNRPYTELVYQPMLELLAYLRANGFKTYIVSGGGAEFIRAFSERAYGIPPEQVIGTTIETRFQAGPDGAPALVRQPRVDFIDDGPGKPVAIGKFIGRRPILAFGNSDGDHQMLQWTAAVAGRSLVGLVHHTDGDREWAYDRQSHVGRLDRALVEARTRGWTIADMKQDWKVIFPFDR